MDCAASSTLQAGDTRLLDAMPTALVKLLSGSAARPLLTETTQGSTETTFYVLAVCFGAVGYNVSGTLLGVR